MRRDRMRIRLRVRFLNDVIWFMMMFHMITTVASTSAFTNTKSLPLLSKYGSRHLYRSSLCMSANSSTSTSTLTSTLTSTTKTNSSKNIAIVGGGLAGLSTAYHLLSKSIDYGIQCPSITIIDKNLPGLGGASSVAGGLLHPFSPKGKLIHFGKEGLDISNKLIQIATNSNPQKPERNQIILRNQIYRIALTEKNVKDLQNTCNLHPEYATWLSSSDVEDRCGSGTDCFGGIVMTDGCKVVHVPSYLQGLWKACEELSLSCQNKAVWSLISSDNDQEEPSKDWWIERLDEFDTVIFSAGSGLFHDSILQQDAIDVPVELVRGQSVEMTLDDSSTNADDTSSTDNDTSPTRSNYSNEALLCGKYIAPLDQGKTKVLIGATHEYKEEPLNENDVVEDLRNRSLNLSHHVWKNGKIDRITLGYRVQSRRGPRGRMPIIGKSQYCDVHRNSWIFTGLSARGLIYHGVYGDTLSDAILKDDESVILERMPEAFWWKKTS